MTWPTPYEPLNGVFGSKLAKPAPSFVTTQLVELSKPKLKVKSSAVPCAGMLWPPSFL